MSEFAVHLQCTLTIQAAEEHCGEEGRAVWLEEGERCEGEKGCIYVMGNFDNSLYKNLNGTFRCVCVCVFYVHVHVALYCCCFCLTQDCRSCCGDGTHTTWMGTSLSLSLSFLPPPPLLLVYPLFMSLSLLSVAPTSQHSASVHHGDARSNRLLDSSWQQSHAGEKFTSRTNQHTCSRHFDGVHVIVHRSTGEADTAGQTDGRQSGERLHQTSES